MNNRIAFIILLFLSKRHAFALDDERVFDLSSMRPQDNPNKFQLWLTISAQRRFLEVSWKNAPINDGDNVLLTKHEPHIFQRRKLIVGTPLARFDGVESGGILPIDGYTTPRHFEDEGSGFGERNGVDVTSDLTEREYWISNNGLNDIVAAVKPSVSSQWFTTGVPFDYALSRNVTINTKCYGYWASYINDKGTILASSCLRAYPRWMNELRPIIGDLRLRDLLIPGTHDSGSFRKNFDPLSQENLITKYSICQDEDIRGQLMHGVRYLDIRVGYYRSTPDLFYVNHGIVRHQPLKEIIDQVKEFVLETNEIVIFGLKEFPVGFGKNLSVHRLLVNYLHQQFGDLTVHPSATWSATLKDLWTRQENIILSYDKVDIVLDHPQILFGGVDQRWGNVQSWSKLEKHLRTINTFDISRLSSRPIVDMAELTPETLDVILDKYGGLRKMADKVNWRVSQLYRDELGKNANIVAVDFIRGTTLIETAIDFNYRKITFP